MKEKANQPYYQESMHKGAPPESFLKAELLRKNMTAAEKLLWEKLKGSKLGVKFRRQHPIQLFIVDFYCHSLKLIIEVDGSYHILKEQKLKDQERSEILSFQDLEVIRFSNEEVLQNSVKVVETILEEIEQRKTL